MLIIREVFTAKPGQASKLAGLFKKVIGVRGSGRVLTDCIGDFNTVVMETEVESLADFEREIKEYQSGSMQEKLDPETRAAMSTYMEKYLTGRREVFQIVA